MNGQIVDPTTVAFIPGHHGANDLAIGTRHKEHLRLHCELAAYIAVGIVPGNNQTALGPEPDYGFFIG
jgi:hypothetical protein